MFNNFVGDGKTRTSRATFVTLFIQSIIVGGLLLTPLIWTETMPDVDETILLVAPPAPPPPPLGISKPHNSAKPKVPQVIEQPTIIPPHIDTTPDPPKIPDAPKGTDSSGDPNGVAGGVPGGTPGGTVGGIVGGTGTAPPVPAPTPTRIRVGGDVTAAKIKKMVKPVYPSMARSSHTEGTVILHAIIMKDGSVGQLEVLSGPPLLRQSSLDAVLQWQYYPTLLNGKVVEVDTTISVVYRLS